MTDQKKETVKRAKKEQSTHVKMRRGDKFADVHVDEVDNYKRGGWELCQR